MDLLSPCRSCLQCLPFFRVSPPSSPRRVAAAPSTSSSHSQEALTGTDPLHSTENLPCPDAVHATQAQGVCPLSAEEQQKGAPQDASCFEEGSAGKLGDDSLTATESDVVAPAISGIVIAPPVSANPSGTYPPEDTEQNKCATLSEAALNVPFINDVTFAPSGFMTLPSPITPAPFGSGYPAGQYPLHDQIYQGQQKEHEHSHEVQENAHHDHEYSPQGTTASHANSHHEVDHGHDLSHHGQEHGRIEHVNSHHESSGHGLSHHGHEQSHHGHEHDPSHRGREHDHSHHDHLEVHGPEHSHWHTSPHSEVLRPEQSWDDSKGSDELCKGDNFSQHAHHHHNHVSAMALHGAENNDDQPHHVEDSIPTSSLETSSSTPELDTEAKVNGNNSAVSPTNAVPALMESYHSEPIVLFEDLNDADRKPAHDEVLSQHSASHAASRRRRREQFKDQLKGIKQQIKQGGHHIKEEGNKHMQTIIENMNKHAQQIEGSGSFSIVPRANNN